MGPLVIVYTGGQNFTVKFLQYIYLRMSYVRKLFPETHQGPIIITQTEVKDYKRSSKIWGEKSKG